MTKCLACGQDDPRMVETYRPLRLFCNRTCHEGYYQRLQTRCQLICDSGLWKQVPEDIVRNLVSSLAVDELSCLCDMNEQAKDIICSPRFRKEYVKIHERFVRELVEEAFFEGDMELFWFWYPCLPKDALYEELLNNSV